LILRGQVQLGRVETPLAQFLVIRFRQGRELEKTLEQFLIPRAMALFQQGAHMVRVFDVLSSVVRAHVLGNQMLLMKDAQLIRIGVENQSGPRIFGGH
jgi:hypothetical protein